MEENFAKKINNALKLIDLKLDESKIEVFYKLYNELVKYNKKVNLTGIVDIDGFIYKHILDSLIPFKVINDESKVLDLGTGAGFPALPLKLINDSLNITCVDSVNKKIEWLNYVSKMAKLSRFSSIHARCEDLAYECNFRESYDYVVSRAVASLNTLIEYAVPFLKVGGIFIAYKSIECETELKDAKNAIKELNIELIDKIEFNHPNLGNRIILIFKKKGSTISKYPRKLNKPRINPL